MMNPIILTVKRKIPQTPNSFSIFFEKPQNFHFYAGQYLDISLPEDLHDPLGKVRAFTISSSPTENDLMITPKKGRSIFKKYLEDLQPGDKISISHPAGTFILDENEPAIFIAGGIGITPFRSMIKYVVDQGLKTSITLIYSNSDENFTFKEELDEWQKIYPQLEIKYVARATNPSTTLGTGYQSLDYARDGLPIYYLAGPPKMVDHFEKMLLKLGVDQVNIRYDPFDGY